MKYLVGPVAVFPKVFRIKCIEFVDKLFQEVTWFYLLKLLRIIHRLKVL